MPSRTRTRPNVSNRRSVGTRGSGIQKTRIKAENEKLVQELAKAVGRNVRNRKMLFNEFRRGPERVRKEIIQKLIEEAAEVKRTNFFDALNDVFSGATGFRKDFEHVGNQIIEWHRKQSFKRNMLCSDEAVPGNARGPPKTTQESKRNELKDAAKAVMKSDGSRGFRIIEDLSGRHMCAYEILLTITGKDEVINFMKKSSEIYAAQQQLFHQSYGKLCDDMDVSLLCMTHPLMKQCELMSCYDLFNYHSERYIGSPQAGNSFSDFIHFRHDEQHHLPELEWNENGFGDAHGRVALGIFLSLLEAFLQNMDGLRWKELQNDTYYAAELVEDFRGELAAEAFAILYRIFNDSEPRVQDRVRNEKKDMPKIPKYEGAQAVAKYLSQGNVHFYNEFGGNMPRDKALDEGRAYIRRLLYTSKRYCWFLNVSAAPLLICMLEQSCTTEGFLQRSSLQSVRESEPEFSIHDLHRDFAVSVENGSAEEISHRLHELMKNPSARPARGAEYRKNAFREMNIKFLFDLFWNDRTKVEKIAIGVVGTLVLAGAAGSIYYLSTTNAAASIATKNARAVNALGWRAMGVAPDLLAATGIISPETAATLKTATKIGERGGDLVLKKLQDNRRWHFQMYDTILGTLAGATGNADNYAAFKNSMLDTATKTVTVHNAYNAATGKRWSWLGIDASYIPPGSLNPIDASAADIGGPAGSSIDDTSIVASQPYDFIDVAENTDEADVIEAIFLGQFSKLDDVFQSAQISRVGSWVANSSALLVMGTALNEEFVPDGADEAELANATTKLTEKARSTEFSREVEGLLAMNPDRIEVEYELRSLVPLNMKKATFSSMKTRSQAVIQRPLRVRPVGSSLDIVAPLSCDLGGLRM